MKVLFGGIVQFQPCKLLLSVGLCLFGIITLAEVTLTVLPDIPDDEGGGVANAISSNKEIIAGGGYTAQGTEAFVWDKLVPMALGDLPGGLLFSGATAVSSDGQRIAGFGNTGFGTQAVLWEGSSLTQLPDIGGGDSKCGALGISGDGTVVVGWGTNFNNRFEAVRWVNGVPEGLGNMSGGLAMSYGRGISTDGLVVVGWVQVTGGQEAMKFTGGTMTTLGDFEGGSLESYASDADIDGSIIVGRGASADGFHACYWDSTGIHALEDLPGGPLSCEAWAVDGDGSVIVGYGTGASYWKQAVVWLKDNNYAPVTLDELLDNAGVDRQGFSCWEALGVSTDGSAVVGYGYIDQTTQAAFVVDLGGPASWGPYIISNGWADTGAWLGWLKVDNDPWVWSDSLQSWMNLPPDTLEAGEGWVFVPR
ncbi:hypothetical protein G0Q06_04215 [Puniceicoccales bacterium CK1056]|uniref:HAF family extracellular repeat protein n=1 Tax=Oceanipulchritudo coccoides TaxID=2706888 RepID=A0A6B2LYI0_9BACT|nr:hypothetical protein [Oceanipulchritudo coccoides]NDV61648.1 hypothetical protein [Oceanipulchritudo coccoides]